jgi:DNA-binding NarL/FixJ family response regulator
MAAVMIGIDPHKGSHTAVAISPAEEPLGELRVRASVSQTEQLLAWAAAWPERAWAIEGAGGLGHLLAQQLLAAGERVLDVQPKLGARVRLLANGAVNKNDPNDARSVAVAALRSPSRRQVQPDDHAAVLKVWSKRHRDLGRTRTQIACRLHAVLCELIPGGVSKEITAAHAAQLLESITPAGAVETARCELAAAFLDDLRRIDAQLLAGQAAADAVAEDAATAEAADEVAAASLAQSLATIAAADEVALEAAGEAGERVRAASITVAEAQVLRYLPKPLPFSVIADKLSISRSAAKERAARLYKRLGVHSRDEAVSRARSLGLIRG